MMKLFSKIKFKKYNKIKSDIAFDWYGNNLATCSTDKTVKIWTRDHLGKWNH